MNDELLFLIKKLYRLSKADIKVFAFLTDNPNIFYSCETIASYSKFDLTTIQRAVKKLKEFDFLERSQENLSGGGYLFKYKIKPVSHLKILITKSFNFKYEKENTLIKEFK